jgi:hypothetical protein
MSRRGLLAHALRSQCPLGVRARAVVAILLDRTYGYAKRERVVSVVCSGSETDDAGRTLDWVQLLLVSGLSYRLEASEYTSE